MLKTSRLQTPRAKYTTTWKIIHELSGKGNKASVKANTRDGTLVKQIYLEYGENTSALCSTTVIFNHHWLSPLLLPRTYWPWPIYQHRRRRFQPYTKWRSARLLGLTVQLQLKPSRMVVIQWLTLSSGPPVSLYLYIRRERPLPDDQLPWNIPLVNQCKGAHEILFNRIRDHMDLILRKYQAGFWHPLAPSTSTSSAW